MLYFAYGSNMLLERLQTRVRSAKKLGVAYLAKHTLSFHKQSVDGSGKCDAFYTGQDADGVYGVIYRIDDTERERLSLAEGKGYCLHTRFVTKQRKKWRVCVFLAESQSIRENLQPYSWYKELVLLGAIQNQLPKDYIERLKALEATEDPDRLRTETNLDCLPPPTSGGSRMDSEFLLFI